MSCVIVVEAYALRNFCGRALRGAANTKCLVPQHNVLSTSMDACQTVKGQVVKVREADTGRWEIPIFRLWTNGKRIFPFVKCLPRELSSHCSMWTNGKFFLPLVQDMRGVWASGKKRKLDF